MTVQDPHTLVRERYSEIARNYASDEQGHEQVRLSEAERARLGRELGYSDDELNAHPASNLGLGCGNPLVLANLRPGDHVVDLGSGGGFDALLAAERVGPSGYVIGVDMTDDMLELARTKASRGGVQNVEFRKGMIEDLPVDDRWADVLISNCVINLSPDKPRVYAEAYRVLKPGGWLSVSDIVLNIRLPKIITRIAGAYVSCLAGAMLKSDYLDTIAAVGFERVEVGADIDAIGLVPPELLEKLKSQFRIGGLDLSCLPKHAVSSLHVRAYKPVSAS